MEGLATLIPAPDPFSDLSPATKLQPLIHSVMPQPEVSLSNTTFFIDSDVDSESEAGESFEEPSPADDVESVNLESTNASSPANLDPPQDPQSEHSPNLMFRLKSIKRSRNNSNAAEEHCFRATLASGQLDWESYQPDPVADPVPAIPAQLRPQSPDTKGAPASQTPEPSESVGEVRRWSTQQVAAWMLNSGFDNSIVSSFQTHDIDGAVLLDLAFDDLKDLDISSYGKRSQIWNEIKALRIEGSLDDPMYTSNTALVRVPSCVDLPSGGVTDRTYYPDYQQGSTQARSCASSASTTTVVPTSKHSSGSISAQDIPKPHRCSKGTKCPKWQKQQTVLEEVDKEHGPNTPPTDDVARMSATPPLLVKSDSAPEESTRSPSLPVANVNLTSRLHAPHSSPEIKHPLKFQHVVQSKHDTPGRPDTSSLSSTDTLTASSTTQPESSTTLSPTTPSFIYPPRQSSRVDLPRLSIPPSPTASRHTPSNSDSSIINVNKALSPIVAGLRPARSTSVPPSTTTQPLSPIMTTSPIVTTSPISTIVTPSSPPSVLAPLRSPKPSGFRSPSPGSAARSSTAPVSPFSRTASPTVFTSHPQGLRVSPVQTSNPSMAPPAEPKPLVPAPLFNRSTTPSPDLSGRLYTRSTTPSPDPSGMRATPSLTGRRPPMLRAPLSADTLNRRRNVNPLPTLQETSTKKSKRISKPLPATPRKSTSSDETAALPAPPVPTTKPTATPAVPPTPSKQDAPPKPEPPPTPMRSSPTKLRPSTATPGPTPSTANTMLGLPPTPQTPATPFTPMTPVTPGPFSASSTSTSHPPMPRLPAKLPRQAYGPSTLRVGWVRRRRARLWRHEWTSVHLRLTNTTLAIHVTADASDTTPLESIDVDDYVVACSSIGNGGSGGTGSKLAAAVRGLRLYGGSGASTGAAKGGMMGSAVLGSGPDSENGTSGGGTGAFSWQLVPAAAVGEKAGHVRTEKNGDGEDTTIVVKSPKVNVTELGVEGTSSTKDKDTKDVTIKEKEREKEKVVLKTHHFAVKTRDERIDWMREVMLAKALRQKEMNARRVAIGAGVRTGVGKVGGAGGVAVDERRLTRSGSF